LAVSSDTSCRCYTAWPPSGSVKPEPSFTARCSNGSNVSREERLTDDYEAVVRTRDGDLGAYEVLVARYTAAAHRTAYLLGAGHEAEDVVQEAFVKAFRALPSFRDGATFRPWLLRIVANETRNLVRSRERRGALELRVVHREVVDHDGPESEAVAGETRAVLLDAVRALPERNRLVVICRYFLDLSETETAQVLGWPRGSVKSRLSRALDRLRPALVERLEEGAVGD
jgi:RNA polymerase sigma-70 factor (ECF subfamily)